MTGFVAHPVSDEFWFLVMSVLCSAIEGCNRLVIVVLGSISYALDDLNGLSGRISCMHLYFLAPGCKVHL